MKVAILGAGSWGSTLTWLLASSSKEVALWTRSADKAASLRANRKMELPLKVTIPPAVTITSDMSEALSGAGVVVFCCTAQSVRAVALLVKQALAQVVGAGGSGKSQLAPILVNAAKGIELESNKRMSEILLETLSGLPVCVLSGPNLAPEVLKGLPTAAVIASGDLAYAQQAQKELSVSSFRLYTNTDIVGVELGGAVKNIIALAAGGVDGLSLGTNAKAALMTRGLAEMTRLAVALGARPTTLSGLAGMGDLVATCYSSLSRNYRLGYQMARGATLVEAEESLGGIAEGVTTARAVCELSQKLSIELPIAQQVDATLRGKTTPEKAIMALMTRPLASE